MSETPASNFSTERKLGALDFSRGFVEAARLYTENPDIRTTSGTAVVTGLISAFPEKVNFECLNKSPEFARLCAISRVAVLINDYIDMQGYLDSPEGKELKVEIEQLWEDNLKKIGFDNQMPLEDKKTIQSYMAGITLLDSLERENPDNSSKGIIKAKELENAISIVHCSATLLTQKEINADCFDLQEDIHKKQLEEKYAWMLEGNPENEVQRRLCGIYNIIMLTQTIDDQFDFKVDDTMQIKNLYSSILKEHVGCKDKADKRLEEIQNHYFANAKKFGITNLAFLGNKIAFNLYKTMQYKFPEKVGGYRERLCRMN